MKTLPGILLLAATAFGQSNPTQTQTDAARRLNYCSDPWVTLAVKAVTGRNPQGLGQFGECNVQLYNGGSWQSYSQLVGHVQSSLGMLRSQGLSINLKDNGNRTLTVSTTVGAAKDIVVVIGSIVIDQGANVVSSGAGNIVSHDGGTLLNQDGSSMRTLASATRVVLKLPGNRVMIVGK